MKYLKRSIRFLLQLLVAVAVTVPLAFMFVFVSILMWVFEDDEPRRRYHE